MYEPSNQADFLDPPMIENAESRLPCILLLDTSASMRGEPIRELNQGLVTFKDELMADKMAVKTVDVAIITFGPVSLTSDFQTPDVFQPPVLSADNDTPMGQAIEFAISTLRERKQRYRQNGLFLYRPWVFLITDGAPTDRWQGALSLIREGEQKGSFSFFAVGVKDADMEILRQLSVKRDPLRLQELRFRDMFSWLSDSLSRVSRSTPGDEVPLHTPYGWASV